MAKATLSQATRKAAGPSAGRAGSLIDAKKRRRIESWRKGLARYARKAERDLAAGKLKSDPAAQLVKRLHRLADNEA